MSKKDKVKFEFYDRPGHVWSEQKLQRYVEELRSVASECFDAIPMYQILTGNREELKRIVLVLARNEDGKAIGFSSSLAIERDVLHLGLTCVIPEARKGGMTHKLMSKLVLSYMVRNRIFTKLWITNCACVISSLGNIALNFDNVYPSPISNKEPSRRHIEIARKINKLYREPIAINSSAIFDEKNFVFRESVKGTVFQKQANDKRYHHREEEVTNFYQNIMNFEEGDEVLQVANVSIASFPKYFIKQVSKKKKKSTKLIPTDKAL